MMGEVLAAFALAAWPFVSLFLYKKLRFSVATILVILGGQLLLPETYAFKITGVPQFDKYSIPCLTVLMAYILIKKRPPPVRAGGIFGSTISVAFLISPLITALLNEDPVPVSSWVIPGVGIYDGISAVYAQYIFVIPLFLASYIIRTQEDIENLLKCLSYSCILYSILMLFELRFSPVLSLWVYGDWSSSAPTDFRYGGYRPVVFMRNGLTVSVFVAASLIATIILLRLRIRGPGIHGRWKAVYLSVLLVLCKSLGSMVYGVVFGLSTYLLKPRLQMRLGLIITLLVVLYPTLRITGNFPDRVLVDYVSSYDAERADSLQTRFEQEDALLAHASERFWFGWGRFGRNRVYNEEGEDVSLTDGRWIITMGQFGFVGFLCEFCLLAYTIFRASTALKYVRDYRGALTLVGLSTVLVVYMVDQIPNASLSPFVWLIAGALLGRTEAAKLELEQSKGGSRVGASAVSHNSHPQNRLRANPLDRREAARSVDREVF